MSLEHAPIRQSGAAQPKPLSVTVKTACAITGLGRTKIYDLIKQGKLRIVKIDTRTLVNYGDLERLASGDAA